MAKHFRNTFLAGALAAVPLAATAFVIMYIESRTRELFRIDVPFLGVLIAIVSIYLLGLIVTSILGRYIVSLLDRLLARLPVLREMYQAWKQVSLPGGEGMFSRVVMIPAEDGRLTTIGFTNGRLGSEERICVFVPAAPNLTSGRLYFVNASDCQYVDMTAQEAFKMILSSGNYVPDALAGTSNSILADRSAS